MIYLRLLKVQVQDQMHCGEHAVRFLLDMQTIAYDLSKSVVLDASLFKYRPAILGACMIFLGFQLQFELNQADKQYELHT